MTQEQKDILLKDICARLPYGVKCCICNFGENTIRIKEDILWSVQGDNILTLKSYVEKGEAYMYHQIKPYLFPLSSMTDEQEKDVYEICKSYLIGYESKLIDFYHKNHLDYRGLIPMGLAIDATGLNIY